MPYDNAGYRDHCYECRHFVLDEKRTKLMREIYGRYMPKVYYCKKLHIFVEPLDSPNNPSSASAGCYSFEKAGKRQRYRTGGDKKLGSEKSTW